MDTAPSSDLFLADMDGETPTRDLHGLDREEALSELRYFLKQQRGLMSPAIRIIHGRGDGILRRAVHEHLLHEKQAGRVIAFRDSENPSQAGAVTIALLPRAEGIRLGHQ